MRDRFLSKIRNKPYFIKFSSIFIIAILMLSFITTASIINPKLREDIAENYTSFYNAANQHDFTSSGHSEIINDAIFENINRNFQSDVFKQGGYTHPNIILTTGIKGHFYQTKKYPFTPVLSITIEFTNST